MRDRLRPDPIGFVDHRAPLGGEVEPDALIAHCRERLAPYKAPRRLRIVDTVPRAPNGKADYKAARALLTT